MITHFLVDTPWGEPLRSLCGEPVEGLVLTDRPATCRTCRRIHHTAGWTFPLPATAA